jgi:hypothetical protein
VSAQTQSNQVFGLPSSYDSYIRAGWSLVPIPRGTKGPKTTGWNKRENALKDANSLPPDHGVGLAHAYSGTCAIDIDAWDSAVIALAEHHVDLNALYAAPDAVTINSGRTGRGKLIYAMPFGLTLPSKKITDENGTVVYELRCASANGLTVQDVLPPSYHPDTGKPYQWGGKGKWTDLPTLPIELITLWQSLVSKDSERTITNGTIDASWDEIKSALYAVNPECNREDWLNCMMALHYAGINTSQEAQAFHLADDWSSQAPTKYKGKQDIIAVWKSFRDHPDGVKLGTLFHVASQHGWKRPTPDVSALFKGKMPDSPDDLITGLQTQLPEINLSLFPPVLAQRSSEVAVGVGCNVLIPLWAGMIAISTAADAQSRLEIMEGFKVPPILRTMVIGDPSGKKSPGSQPMLEVFERMEQEELPAWKRKHLEWEALDIAYKSSRKAYNDAAASADFLLSGMDLTTLPPVAAEAPPMPAQTRYLVRDITSQKLGRMCADRPQGVTCYMDEMKSWLDSLSNPKSGEKQSTWTEAYEGKVSSVDRVSELDPIMVQNFAVPIFGNVQTEVYKSAFKKMGQDGLLQRFIPVPLTEKKRPIGEPVPAYMSNIVEYEALVRKIAKTPAMTYTLDSQAYDAYREFQEWHNETKADESLLKSPSVFLQCYGKLEGLTGRIALILHLCIDPSNPIVTYATMANAIELIRSYVIPAYRYSLYELGGSDGREFDKWLVDHIIQISGDTLTVNSTDLRRSARRPLAAVTGNKFVQDELIGDAMHYLEKAGYVAQLDESKRGIVTWAIDPRLATLYPEHRLKIIKAKQRQADERHRIVTSNGVDMERRIVRGYKPDMMD